MDVAAVVLCISDRRGDLLYALSLVGNISKKIIAESLFADKNFKLPDPLFNNERGTETRAFFILIRSTC